MGGILDFFKRLPGRFAAIAGKMIRGFINVLLGLPGQVGFILGFVVGRVIRFGIDMVRHAIETGQRFAINLLLFIRELPGQIGAFLMNILMTLMEWGPQFAQGALDFSLAFATNIMLWIQGLPAWFAGIFMDILQFLIDFVPRAWQTALDIGTNLLHGITDIVTGLPDILSGILDAVIGVFIDMVETGYNAARSFASGLWEGFKEGLGINSPSFIEEALFSIDDQVKSSTAHLASQVAKIQRISSGIPTLNENALGMTTPAVAANGGLNANTWNQNGPLIGSATIRSDQDIVELGRQLERERQLQARARGIAKVGV
jgi:hypothetical protein